MGALDATRIALGAGAVGLATAAFEHALDYANERERFGQVLRPKTSESLSKYLLKT